MTVLRKLPNPLPLRCPRPTRPCGPSCVHSVRTPVPPLVRVCVRHNNAWQPCPHPAPSCAGTSAPAALGPRPERGWRQWRFYLLGYQQGTLGPEAQQLLRGGEGQEGGDVCRRRGGQDRSWFLGDGRHRWLWRGPRPNSLPRRMPLTWAAQGSESRISPGSPRVRGLQRLALVSSSCRSL